MRQSIRLISQKENLINMINCKGTHIKFKDAQAEMRKIQAV